MAFVRKNFERVAGGDQKLFLYDAGADTIATVRAANYFNAVGEELDQGDVVIVKHTGNTLVATVSVTSADRAAVVAITQS